MNNVFSDQNLESIFFTNNGKSLKLTFIDMHEGNTSSIINCNNIQLFNFQSKFDDDEFFPCHVGDVTSKVISSTCIKNELGCEQVFEGEKEIVDDRVLLKLVGGEIHIEIVCKEVLLNSEIVE